MRFIRKLNQISFFKQDEFLQTSKDNDKVKDEVLDNIEAISFSSDYTSNKSLDDNTVDEITETKYYYIIKEKSGVYTFIYKDEVHAFAIKFYGNKVVVVNPEVNINTNKKPESKDTNKKDM